MKFSECENCISDINAHHVNTIKIAKRIRLATGYGNVAWGENNL